MEIKCIHCKTEMKPICERKDDDDFFTLTMNILRIIKSKIYVCDKEIKLYECPSCGYCEWRRVGE